MNTAVIVMCSIVIFLQVILYIAIIWVAREDKKSKGKSNEDEELYLLDKELWEISTKIEELNATFKCKKNRYEFLQYKNEKNKIKDIFKEEA
jgi:hypothetical protein